MDKDGYRWIQMDIYIYMCVEIYLDGYIHIYREREMDIDIYIYMDIYIYIVYVDMDVTYKGREGS
jgi:hypothetical protein